MIKQHQCDAEGAPPVPTKVSEARLRKEYRGRAPGTSTSGCSGPNADFGHALPVIKHQVNLALGVVVEPHPDVTLHI